MGIKKGDTARLVQPTIQGVVVDRRVNPDTDEIEVLLSYVDGEGHEQQRWLNESQLEAVAAEEITQ